MPMMEFLVRRFSIVSKQPFEETLRTLAESIGASGLMEVSRFDAGAAKDSRIIRLLVGNPVLMKEIARTAPNAAAYAPATILIDERSDGVHLSYDLMSSLIAPDSSPEALTIAHDLDTKIISLLERAAASSSDDAARDKPDDPIALAGSLAATDVMLMGVFLDDW